MSPPPRAAGYIDDIFLNILKFLLHSIRDEI